MLLSFRTFITLLGFACLASSHYSPPSRQVDEYSPREIRNERLGYNDIRDISNQYAYFGLNSRDERVSTRDIHPRGAVSCQYCKRRNVSQAVIPSCVLLSNAP
jgi:hypothetical protein